MNELGRPARLGQNQVGARQLMNARQAGKPVRTWHAAKLRLTGILFIPSVGVNGRSRFTMGLRRL